MNPEVTKTRKKKKRRTRFLFLLGLVLCAYPLISSIYERQHQQSAVATYQKEIEKIDTNELDQELADAKKYNEMLWQLHGIVVDSIQEDVLSESNYNSLLNFSSSLYGMMGTLSIPKISVNLPIYHGTSDRLVVTGERIEYKESTAKNVKPELMSFRELFFTALPFLFIGYAAFQIVKSRRKMKRETKQILQDEED